MKIPRPVQKFSDYIYRKRRTVRPWMEDFWMESQFRGCDGMFIIYCGRCMEGGYYKRIHEVLTEDALANLTFDLLINIIDTHRKTYEHRGRARHDKI